MQASLLKDMPPDRFLAAYWQKKPLIIRRALAPGADFPLVDANELAGLACEADVESRLIIGGPPWAVQHGPFNETTLGALPDRQWTLLCQDVDKHLPDLAAVFDWVGFLPDWRLDDLMISAAAPGGSVGPHMDEYDVFLVQASGRRRWQLELERPLPARIIDEAGMRHVADMTARIDCVLEPGDVLYLPPGLPHHGVALDLCVTYSIGFRAPRLNDLIGACLDRALDHDHAAALYADPDLHSDEAGLTLGERSVARIKAQLKQAMQRMLNDLPATLGQALTETNQSFAPVPPAEASKLKAGDTLRCRKNPASRWLVVEAEDGPTLYVDGESTPIATAHILPLQRLAARREWQALEIADAGLAALCRTLLDRGALLNEDDWRD